MQASMSEKVSIGFEARDEISMNFKVHIERVYLKRADFEFCMLFV